MKHIMNWYYTSKSLLNEEISCENVVKSTLPTTNYFWLEIGMKQEEFWLEKNNYYVAYGYGWF